MIGLGVPELLIILAIVILVFGAGRISKIAAELGSGIRSLRENMQDTDKDKKADE